MSSNRTFMELKFMKKIIILFVLARSNRTFMELKYVSYGVAPHTYT